MCWSFSPIFSRRNPKNVNAYYAPNKSLSQNTGCFTLINNYWLSDHFAGIYQTHRLIAPNTVGNLTAIYTPVNQKVFPQSYTFSTQQVSLAQSNSEAHSNQAQSRSFKTKWILQHKADLFQVKHTVNNL